MPTGVVPRQLLCEVKFGGPEGSRHAKSLIRFAHKRLPAHLACRKATWLLSFDPPHVSEAVHSLVSIQKTKAPSWALMFLRMDPRGVEPLLQQPAPLDIWWKLMNDVRTYILEPDVCSSLKIVQSW